MSKGLDQKKNTKKKAQKTPDEKRAAFRTAMQCKGRRRNGEVFLADMWFSTYRTTAGPRLAAMVVDVSDELRNREESTLLRALTIPGA